MEITLRTEVETLIKKYRKENTSSPNGVLADYLTSSLKAFDKVLDYHHELIEKNTPAKASESTADSVTLTTLDEAVAYLLPRFEGMEKYMGKSEEEFTAFCHSELSGGIGMKIQRELKLWVVESPLHQYFLRKHNLLHLDEMSDLIIRGVYQKFNRSN
ncbi:DUF6794 domain-containing protein [Spirosoma endophyticum]|uniref:DUF6794 domain-containing protein n=1 Tax=Spirosoma endophyticum TaxID=662367 RepID=A0A1I1SHA1_9BACT|nr:DUF6794 domain-containing protein [Spirosoma endophyticum]SFD45859.1 hypothetical protein SAMN05216167_105110 [Spirosoma endophyticum]